MNLRKAIVYENKVVDGGVITRVKILPDLAEIKLSDTKEAAKLPAYPPFFKGEVGKYVSYKDTRDVSQGDEEKCTKVWVICTDDLVQGYILGPCIDGCAQSKDAFDMYPKSYSFAETMSQVSRAHGNEDHFKENELSVLFITPDLGGDKGGAIGLVNYLYGDIYIMLSAGTTICINGNILTMRVGSPGEGNPKSQIEITATQMDFYTKQFIVHADKVNLGGEHMKAVGTTAFVDRMVLGMDLMHSSVVTF